MSNSKVYNSNSNDLINFQYGGFVLYCCQPVYNNSNWYFEIQTINTFIGLYALFNNNENLFSFETSAAFNDISASADLINYYDMYYFNILTMYSRYCDYKTPYYNPVT
jgi:hypothetical protein